jgi:hypothetical protein
MTPTTMLARIRAIEAKLRAHPAWFETQPLALSAPASGVEIARLEEALGRRLPAVLRDFLGETAGSTTLHWRPTEEGVRALDARYLYGCLDLYSPASILERRAALQEEAARGETERAWIDAVVPFAGMGAQSWGIDYSERHDPEHAPIVFLKHDEPKLYGGSFGGFASFFAGWSAAGFIERFDEAPVALLDVFMSA